MAKLKKIRKINFIAFSFDIANSQIIRPTLYEYISIVC